jgi:hypothetical protein
MVDNFYVPDLKSPLQNAGVNAVCVAAPVFARDAYGQRRPRASLCSIGAVEATSLRLSITSAMWGHPLSVPLFLLDRAAVEYWSVRAFAYFYCCCYRSRFLLSAFGDGFVTNMILGCHFGNYFAND